MPRRLGQQLHRLRPIAGAISVQRQRSQSAYLGVAGNIGLAEVVAVVDDGVATSYEREDDEHQRNRDDEPAEELPLPSQFHKRRIRRVDDQTAKAIREFAPILKSASRFF